ncbi:hypothetical protein ACFLIM_32195 [Nonomuraea sp. M3C6]|uniref:Uncharacterized protein n=1 Tax=Nonomuraea marmarensis TaxID=3351344 RepID=A0ABW7AL87_9ACTN
MSPDMVAGSLAGGQDYWGAVRPPGFPPGKAVPSASPQSETAQGQESGTESDTGAGTQAGAGNLVRGAGQDSGGLPAYTLLIAAAGGALLAAAALRWSALLGLMSSRGLVRLPRRRKDEPDPPVDESADTIVISG